MKEVTLPKISITPNDLRAAFLKWEYQRRLGQCVSEAEVAEQPAERVAEQNAATLWNELVAA
jgi:hypothetical protein